jgi:hypothetical protein
MPPEPYSLRYPRRKGGAPGLGVPVGAQVPARHERAAVRGEVVVFVQGFGHHCALPLVRVSRPRSYRTNLRSDVTEVDAQRTAGVPKEPDRSDLSKVLLLLLLEPRDVHLLGSGRGNRAAGHIRRVSAAWSGPGGQDRSTFRGPSTPADGGSRLGCASLRRAPRRHAGGRAAWGTTSLPRRG